RHAFAEFSAGNPASFLELIAPDVVYTVIGRTALSGTFRGRDDCMRRLFAPLAAALATPIVLTLGDVIADRERVALRATGHAPLRRALRQHVLLRLPLRRGGDRRSHGVPRHPSPRPGVRGPGRPRRAAGGDGPQHVGDVPRHHPLRAWR